MKKVEILGVTEITIAKAHDSVYVLADNVQVRTPVLANDASLNGEVIEACAGLIDRDVKPIEIAKTEVLYTGVEDLFNKTRGLGLKIFIFTQSFTDYFSGLGEEVAKTANNINVKAR